MNDERRCGSTLVAWQACAGKNVAIQSRFGIEMLRIPGMPALLAFNQVFHGYTRPKSELAETGFVGFTLRLGVGLD